MVLLHRDLQRHRMLTLEWQRLSPNHGYVTPASIVDVEATALWDEAMERTAGLVGRDEPTSENDFSIAITEPPYRRTEPSRSRPRHKDPAPAVGFLGLRSNGSIGKCS